ncbi:La-related protein 6C [Carex littledalei]|uniref:La-related protein 6C n=1 Tax=Carex littledalei TaxID=544730 RepID=A0A833QUF6_9POAL|nr:La-related protein 6C [Carex littledalei]
MLSLSKRKPDISENPLFPGKDVKNLMTMRNQLAIDDRPTEEELQARTVIAENIPANYLLENLEKLFCYLGSVKSFRVRNPQDPNLAGCSRDVLTIREGWWNSKRTLTGLHAIVEYGTERAANRTIRYFDQYPHQKGGFRVRSRRDYSIASEKNRCTMSDMDSDLVRSLLDFLIFD